MTPLRLRTPEEIETTDPLRARYVRLLIHAATTGEPAEASPMDAGLALCDALAGRPLRAFAVPEAPIDSGGHRRSFYRSLALYAQVLAAVVIARGRIKPSPLRTALWPIANAIQAIIPDCTDFVVEFAGEDAVPAARADDACRWAWTTVAESACELALHGDLWTGKLRRGNALSLLTAAQRPGGAFFDATDLDNPEPWWYAELVTLHAVQTYAAFSGDKVAAETARRAAAFHHAETQPDHATSQPWAVHAFLSDPEFVPTADLLLLAATTQQPSALGVVPRLLLADAAVWLSVGKGDW